MKETHGLSTGSKNYKDRFSMKEKGIFFPFCVDLRTNFLPVSDDEVYLKCVEPLMCL